MSFPISCGGRSRSYIVLYSVTLPYLYLGDPGGGLTHEICDTPYIPEDTK